MSLKKCSMCGELKDRGEFHKNKKEKDGLRSRCKCCIRERNKKYYEKNKDKIKKYYEKNKEKIKERNKKYREENREKERERKKKYYEKNKDKTRERQKKYSEENKEKIKERNKKYYEKNIIIINKEEYNLNIAPPELKPALETLIFLRNKKNIIKEVKNHE